jgi:hypothetical protein
MTLILSGTDGLSDVDGSAATPAIRGTDANTGIFFGADIIGFAEGGAEVARFNADAQFVAAAGTAALPVITTTGDVNTGIFFPAADTIAFSEGGAEAMRIDSSGNVGIGTASPTDTSGYSRAIDLNGSLGAAYYARTSGSSTNYTLFGNYGADGYINNRAAGNILFYNNAAEAMRIDSSGKLLVGTTSSLGTAGSGQFVQAGAGGAGTAISADATSATFAYSVAWFAANRSASSAFNFINCTSDQYGTPQFRVQGNGVILAQNTTVQSISDVRTKENIRDSEEGLQVILGLQPRRFDFKQGFGNGRKNALGFVAQEIETVFPDAVSEVHLDPDSKDIAYKTVGPGELIPVLVKAIQEQQALITTLTDRITALEAK